MSLFGCPARDNVNALRHELLTWVQQVRTGIACEAHETRAEIRNAERRVSESLAGVAGAISALRRLEVMMGAIQDKIDALTAEIEPLTNAVDGLVTLIDGIVQDVEDHKDDPAELQQVIDAVRAQKDKLIAAVVRHTPSDPPVDPPVEG